MQHSQGSHLQADGLADVLERVLDKGIVVAGDISVAVAGIELLSLKIRLVVTTVDKALEMGIDWWQHDAMISSRASTSSTSEGALLGGPRKGLKTSGKSAPAKLTPRPFT
ncbi:MAG: gas vesicle protein [Pseudomonadota bacterium]